MKVDADACKTRMSEALEEFVADADHADGRPPWTSDQLADAKAAAYTDELTAFGGSRSALTFYSGSDVQHLVGRRLSRA